MPWPLSQDYNETIQNPASAFADPELRRSQAATSGLGLPVPCSGNFADVYKLTDPATQRAWAVKCFTRQIPGRRKGVGLGFLRGRLYFPRFALAWQRRLLPRE